MGAIVSRGGHICVDLGNLELAGDHQQQILEAVQKVVIEMLAKIAADTKVVTISMSPNNGMTPRET